MLQKVNFAPGINKQITATAAEGQWIDCDNVRFRYLFPEKIGGWKQLGADNITGAVRAIHQFTNSEGRKYSIIGSNRILYAFSGGVFYDIHPIKSTTTLTNAFSTTNGSSTVTINFSGDHNISAGDIILLDNFSTITNSNFDSDDFDDIRFMVTTVPSSNTITITMPSNESGSGASEHLYLTDDSKLGGAAVFSEAGRIFNLVSGSAGTVFTGVDANGWTESSGSYGWFMPDIGMILLNGPALDGRFVDGGIALATGRNGNTADNNPGKLYDRLNLGGAAATNPG